MRKAVVLFSGGQDSTLTLKIVQLNYPDVSALIVDYGQKHRCEIRCAECLARTYFKVPYTVISCSCLQQIGGSALVGVGDVSGHHEQDAALPASFVPGRNVLFLTMAAAVAYKIGAESVWCGVNQRDYSGYPDCRVQTLACLEDTLAFGLDRRIRICAPLIDKTKAEIWQMIYDYGPEFFRTVTEETHTCYAGGRSSWPWGRGCGDCPACKIRRESFVEFQESLK